MSFLILVGPMASGKSKIGRRVAKISGKKFIDTDKEVVKQHGEIAKIFVEQGEKRFRDLEQLAVTEALNADDAIVSLGGGAPMREATRLLLLDQPVVLLTMNDQSAQFRLRMSSNRPLLQGDGFDAWKRITTERMPIYENIATWTLDTSQGRLDSFAEQILKWREEVYVKH